MPSEIQPAYRVLRAKAQGPYVIFCDHASNHVPAELNSLGLPASELERHIAWDIGAAGITEELSSIFDSPAILCGASRLVIDCNRHLDAHDLIPEISDGTLIPGNQNQSGSSRQSRIDQWFTPYHAAVESVIEWRASQSLLTISLSIHSMTPNLAGNPRPWQISLSSYQDRSLADPILRALRQNGQIAVGDNQPYDLDPAFDFSTPYHALRRSLPHIQVEFRQDEVTTLATQIHWAKIFASALQQST